MTSSGDLFETEKERNRAGFVVRKFLAACDLAYRRSRKGTLPKWVAEIVEGTMEGGDDPVGSLNFKTVPVTLIGFSGESGATVSGWEIGDRSTPILESKAWAALLRLRPLREFWTLELRENHRVQLGELLAEAWVVNPAPVPPHGVIPGLGVQDWNDAPRQLPDGRGLALFVPSPQASVSPEVFWGPDMPTDDWKATLRSAGEGFAQMRVAVAQALPSPPEKAGRYLLE